MESTNKFIHENLEAILFDEDRLTSLKEAIHKVAMGKLSTRAFKDLFLKSQIQLFEKLVDFFPFCVKNMNTALSLDTITNQKDLSPELEEKDNVIKEIGIRIQRIYEKLKEKI
ncbi:MAG: hypothetical protein ACFE9I_01410 [Candidatus Hermodarchaeota archaeon]